jgi:hypothetical protein
MIIEQFPSEKASQISAYIQAVIESTIHYTELDRFVDDTMGEWTLLEVMDEMPSCAQERVFWHLMHEISLHGAQCMESDLTFKVEVQTCLDFLAGIGSYPIDCIGWRPIA